MRKLLAMVAAVVLVDTMFYAAIAPLLPYYAHQFHLAKTQAGVLLRRMRRAPSSGRSRPAGWRRVPVCAPRS